MRGSPCFTAVLLLVGACAPRTPDAVTVLVAASLTDVVTELVTDYRRFTDTRVLVSAGASGALCTQIEWGAPCQLFLSADPHLMARLEAVQRVSSADTRTVARNRLVLATLSPNGFPGDVRSALLSPSVRRIAIADPDSAPGGRYARESLESLGLWDELQPKLVRASDVRAAAHYLTTGTVQLAIVYRTDAEAVDRIMPIITFDEGAHTPIEYVAAVVTGSRDSRRGSAAVRERQARGLLGFLTSERAAPVWRKHGFQPVVASKE